MTSRVAGTQSTPHEAREMPADVLRERIRLIAEAGEDRLKPYLGDGSPTIAARRFLLQRFCGGGNRVPNSYRYLFLTPPFGPSDGTPFYESQLARGRSECFSGPSVSRT